MNVVEWRPRVAYIHWMDGLLATRRSHAEDGGERTRRLGGANLTFGRALALDLEIVGQELDVTLLGDVFASQKVLRESAKAVSDEARSFKVGARGGGALLIVQFLVGLRLGEQIRGEIGASRGDLEAHGGETGETEGERALGRVRLLRRRRLGRGVDLRANTRSMRSIRQSTRSKTTHALSPARALAFIMRARSRTHARIHSSAGATHDARRRSRRVDESTVRSLSLSLSLPPSVVPSSPHASSSIAPPRLRSIHRPYLEVRPPRERDGRPNERDAFDRSGPPRTCTIFAWTVNMSLVKLVVTTTTTTTTTTTDDDRRHDPSTDRVPRANSS